MPEPLLYVKSMGVAAIVSAILMLTMSLVSKTANATWRSFSCTLAIGFGLAAGYHVLSLQLAWPPANALDRLLTIIVPVALGTELIAGVRPVPRWVGWLLRITLAVAIPRILLHGSVYLSGPDDGWTRWQAAALLVVSSVLLAAVWSLLSWLSQRSPGFSVPLSLCLSIQSAGMTVMMAGYIKGGAAAIPMVAALSAATIAAGLLSKRGETGLKLDAPVLLGIGVVSLFGLLFIGRFFGRISTTFALTMLLAPLLCWVTELPWLRHRKPALVGSLRLAFVSIPLIVVLLWAKRNFDREMSPLLVQTSAFTLQTY